MDGFFSIKYAAKPPFMDACPIKNHLLIGKSGSKERAAQRHLGDYPIGQPTKKYDQQKNNARMYFRT